MFAPEPKAITAMTRGTSCGRTLVAPVPSKRDKFKRLLWGMVQSTLYRWSPVPMHGWRRTLLRLFGARIGPGSHSYPDARIWAPWNLTMGADSCLGPRVICYSVSNITLGKNALVSQGAHLCAASHDFRDPAFPLTIGSILIDQEAWVAADAFVGPGVTIGAQAVLGARAVAMRDIPPAMIAVGNPARIVGNR